MIYREFLKKLNTYEFEKCDENRNKILLYILEEFDANVNTLNIINQMLLDNRTDEIIETVQDYLEKLNYDNYIKNKEDEDD
jgi:hypothetical protein